MGNYEPCKRAKFSPLELQRVVTISPFSSKGNVINLEPLGGQCQENIAPLFEGVEIARLHVQTREDPGEQESP